MGKLIRVLHLVENIDDSYGGPAKSVPSLCKSTVDFDVHSEIVSVSYKNNERNELIERYNINWKAFPIFGPKALRYGKGLFKYLYSEAKLSKVDILHVHNLWNLPIIYAFIIGWRFNIPVVISVRGALYEWSLSQSRIKKLVALKLFQKYILSKASCIHVTDLSEKRAVERLGIKSNIRIVPNSIDVSSFQKNCKKAVNKRESKRRKLLFMSRLHPKKGFHLLTEAFARASKLVDGWELIIAGPVYDKLYFEAALSKLSNNYPAANFKYLGEVSGDERTKAFTDADAFVLPSYSENFGVVIAEALASNLPVITTTGTPWRQLKEFNAGFYIHPNVKELEEALILLMRMSSVELETLGSNAKKVVEPFDLRIVGKQFSNLYRELSG